MIKAYQDFLGLEANAKVDFSSLGLIGAGADGASFNFGCHSGMMQKLKEDVPWLVPVHCVSHHLELAIKDAVKNTCLPEVIT